MEDYCQIFQKRSSLIGYIVACLIVIAFGCFYLVNANILGGQCDIESSFCVKSPLYYEMLGRGVVTYFGLCGVVFIFMTIKPYELFHLNADGFWAKNYGFVEWSNVENLHISNIANETVISFKLKDASNVKLPIMTKFFRLLNKNEDYLELSGDYNQVHEVYNIMKSYCQE